MPRPPPPAEALTSTGKPISASDSTVVSGSTGTPAARISALASIFEPIAAIADAGGPIHVSPASTTAWAKRRVSAGSRSRGGRRRHPLRERGVDQQVAAQVRVGGGGARQADGGVGLADVRRVGVGVAEHGDGADAEPAARADDAAGDLAAVGDEHRRW